MPLLLGFHPDRSLVVLGISGPRSRVTMTFRYDLPDPPDPDAAAEILAHARAVLVRERTEIVIMVGYGPGPLVTPLADAVAPSLRGAGIKIQDILRVEDGRYWSYVCRNPRCCPPEGVAFEAERHPAARALAAAGLTAHRDRAELVATLAPDPEASVPVSAMMDGLGEEAARRFRTLLDAGLRNELFEELSRSGREAVLSAISRYREGGSLTEPAEIAWLGMMLSHIAVRDDAWARMEPEHHKAHERLWTDLVRRLPEGFVAAPASLLAFVSWQAGDGVLASIAVERALKDDPDYSMALLIGDALDAGLPPAAARLPMTPEEVEASYAEQLRQRPARPPGASRTRRRVTGPGRG